MRTIPLALLLLSSAAAAEQTTVRVDVGPALPISEPQHGYFSAGPDALGTFSVELSRWLDVRLALGGALFPKKPDAPVSGAGTVWFGGTGLRLRRPWENARVVPFAEAGFFYALTGGLSRVAVDGGAGVLFRPVEKGRLAVGPYLRLQHVFRLTDLEGFRNADAQILAAGIAFEYLIGDRDGETDSDGDGFTNDRDECPAVAGVAPTGCPAGSDSDGDGVLDAVDACPRRFGLPAFKGCPAPIPLTAQSADPDPDHDGVLGDADKCPAEPEDRDGFHDEDGCPDPDNDQDGLADGQDACPLVPGPATTRGCPDSDADGVLDGADGCPDKAGPPENKGCPVYKQVVVTDTRIELLQKILFAFGKAEILPKSFGLLDEVVQAMEDHPKICVRIEGHTDAVGSREKNLKLSDDRAWSVMKYVAEHGVDPLRMSSKGYGPDQPLESNQTSEGRERNRRVEFVILPCDKLK